MVPRPRLEPGETGRVSATQEPDGGWVARARYRRYDGTIRQASGEGPSRGKAEAALRTRVRERLGDVGGSELSPRSTVAQLAAAHLAAELDRTPPLAPNTIREIRNVLALHVAPRLGSLTLQECTTPRVEAAVTALAKAHPAQAKKMRWVLSAMFKRAERLGAVGSSPVESVSPVRVEHAPPIALSVDDLFKVREAIRSHRPAKRGRIGATPAADVLEFLVGTGCRPAEALGLVWEDVHLETATPWVRIHWQVVRVEKVGMRRTPTKGKDTRDPALPRFAAEMLRRRRADDPEGWLVFPSNAGTLKDPRNMRGTWQAALEGTDWEWVTQKVLRKTVATLVAREQSPEAAAGQLGHTDAKVTRKHYIEARREILSNPSMEQFGNTEQFG